MRAHGDRYIGIMSGTSMDGADAVLVDFSGERPAVLAAAHEPFPDALRADFGQLQQPGDNEIHREALAANGLARVYAGCVTALLGQTGLRPDDIAAIGAHGQTIRHRPGLYDETGYTRQSQHPALLAELTGIDVVADFRSRDVAAGARVRRWFRRCTRHCSATAPRRAWSAISAVSPTSACCPATAAP